MSAPSAASPSTVSANVTEPVVVDLGKKSKKQIKNLKRGKGKLVADVAAVIEELKAQAGADAAGKEFVPVVIVYRRKEKRGSGWLPMLG